MNIKLLTLFICGLSAPLSAQSLDDFLACGSVESDIARLQCYDGVSELSASSKDSNGCIELNLRDVLLDASTLRGECVTTTGSVMSLGEVAMISEDMFGANGLYLETDGLNRAERGILLDCAPCRLQVTGIVGEVLFSPGMTLTSIKESR